VTWDEGKHRRDTHGRFTDTAIARWAEHMDAFAERSGRSGTLDSDRVQGLKRSNSFHPEGHAEAAAEHRRLWRIPLPPEQGGQGRDRTDEEHDEAVRLDQAFEMYRETIGLRRNPGDMGAQYTFVDKDRRIFNSYGERMNGKYTHQWAASMQHKDDVVSKRRGEMRGRPELSDARYVTQRYPDTATARTREGDFGYGARADSRASDEGRAQVFVARMRREHARTRQETARQQLRRTPRGTQVDSWMQQVSAQIAQTRGGR